MCRRDICDGVIVYTYVWATVEKFYYREGLYVESSKQYTGTSIYFHSYIVCLNYFMNSRYLLY
jgi:hypothetical protein